MNRDELTTNLGLVVPKYINWTKDAKDNHFGWLTLDRPSQITEVCEALKKHGARLCTMTAYTEKRADDNKRLAVAYHFVIRGVLLNVTVPLYEHGSSEQLSLPSILPYFRNADYNEREIHEMYNVEIENRPDLKRLFLDERIDAGVMGDLIPFSAMANSASTQTLWENIMGSKVAEKAKDEQEAFVAMYVEIKEPKFTAVGGAKKDKAAAPKAGAAANAVAAKAGASKTEAVTSADAHSADAAPKAEATPKVGADGAPKADTAPSTDTATSAAAPKAAAPKVDAAPSVTAPSSEAGTNADVDSQAESSASDGDD